MTDSVQNATPAPVDNTAADPDRIDRTVLKDVLQMILAVLFVSVLAAACVHAASFAGNWPF
ncbi:hypothetical protein LOC54_03055 [Acetobacter sp. AN02]|uniref:hypothetical protein n=1 Tax=Acetobacter sp. AN02 TaxID=2894186 RepID=UPI0024342DC7|nr:hypothetical protein [Acetobacter sp. AN02]MDG6094101.1 hypothetical protein [Acetobacter sp. AN02]